MQPGGMEVKMKMKRWLCGLLACGMTLSLAACGGGGDAGTQGAGAGTGGGASSDSGASSGGGENVVIAVPTPFDMPDAGEVEAAINEIAAERYGVTVTLNFIPMGNWAQQGNLLLTGDEVDVIACMGTPLTTYVKNGQFMELDDFVAGASDEFKEIWSEEELKGTTINGHIYAIPNLRNFGNYFGLGVDEEIAAEYGITDRQTWTMDEISEFLYKVHEEYPDRYALVPQGGSAMVNGWTWDGLGDGKFIGVLPDCGQTTTVQNLFETDDFVEFCTYTRKWYQDGLIMPDALSNTETCSALIQSKKAVSAFENYANNNVEGMIRTIVIDAWSVSNSYAELCYAINTNSKKGEAAWKALEMLYTDQEIATLFSDGIEGKHYVKNEDGTISYPEGKTPADCGYGMAELYWVVPYSGKTLPLDVNGPTFFEDLIAFNEATLQSKAIGFAFDTTEVSDQYTACSNIMDKYYSALLCGTVDVESTIAQANAEFEAAGLKDIIAAKQKQLDAFLGQ